MGLRFRGAFRRAVQAGLSGGIDKRKRELHQHPAVNSEDLTGDVGGLWTCEKCGGVGNVVGLADLTEWDLLQELGALRLGEVLGGHVGLDETGARWRCT